MFWPITFNLMVAQAQHQLELTLSKIQKIPLSRVGTKTRNFNIKKPECEGKVEEIQVCSLNLKTAYLYLAQISLNIDILNFITSCTHVRLLPIQMQKGDNFCMNAYTLLLLSSLSSLVMCNKFGKRHQKLFLALVAPFKQQNILE